MLPIVADVALNATKTMQSSGVLWRSTPQLRYTGITDSADSASTKAQSCWAMACVIQGLLTDTDPENAAAEVDGAQGKQGDCDGVC